LATLAVVALDVAFVAALVVGVGVAVVPDVGLDEVLEVEGVVVAGVGVRLTWASTLEAAEVVPALDVDVW
jgi:hypothetical protein